MKKRPQVGERKTNSKSDVCCWLFLGRRGSVSQGGGSSFNLSRYMGGHFPNPSYLDVLSRITGHAEVAQVEYDPQKVSYEDLLAVFWGIHDPTTLNRQGPDRGEQYRSAIIFHNQEQEEAAKRSKEKLQMSGRFDKEIVTEITPAGEYYLAAQEHQQYFEKKGKRIEKIVAG